MYLFEAGPVTHPATAMKARLVSWAKRFIAFDEPVPIRSGDAVGRRTHITTRKGQPYGELEVFYVDGWEFDIGYQQVNFTAETARLGTRSSTRSRPRLPVSGTGPRLGSPCPRSASSQSSRLPATSRRRSMS